MSAATRLVLVRHGESTSSVMRVIGGSRTCTGLSELGRLQAAALRDRLATSGELASASDATDGVGVGVLLIASAYRRAIETAEIVAPALGTEVQIDEGFGEHDPGATCDGMSFDEFVERFGTPDWERDPHAVTFPGGETVAQFHHRVTATLARVLRDHPARDIVVTCHGGVIDVAFRYLLGLPATGGFELFTLNASLTELRAVGPGRWRLVRYNDAAHLASLPAETPRR